MSRNPLTSDEKMSKPTGYVVYYVERMRDENAEHARCFERLDHAIAFVNKLADSFFGACIESRLFEMGKEVPLVSDDVEEPQPAKVTRRFKVKQ